MDIIYSSLPADLHIFYRCCCTRGCILFDFAAAHPLLMPNIANELLKLMPTYQKCIASFAQVVYWQASYRISILIYLI